MQGCVADIPLGAAQERLDLGIEHRQGERLFHIVVCAQAISLQFVLLSPPRRQKDDRHVALTADGTAHRKAIGLGQHDIKQGQVKILRSHERQRRVPILGADDCGSICLCSKIIADDGAHTRLIFHKQDRVHGMPSFLSIG